MKLLSAPCHHNTNNSEDPPNSNSKDVIELDQSLLEFIVVVKLHIKST